MEKTELQEWINGVRQESLRKGGEIETYVREPRGHFLYIYFPKNFYYGFKIVYNMDVSDILHIGLTGECGKSPFSGDLGGLTYNWKDMSPQEFIHNVIHDICDFMQEKMFA
jgi:hypothetical protein